MADKKMSVRVDENTYASLKELAKDDRRSLTAYVGKLLENHVARKVDK